MGTRGRITVASASYALNCALGTSVATGAIDSSGFRWVHHALYIATTAATALAIGIGLGARRTASVAPALLLLPAAVPLALIPYLGSRSRRHVVVSLAAAPFYLGALARAWAPSGGRY